MLRSGISFWARRSNCIPTSSAFLLYACLPHPSSVRNLQVFFFDEEEVTIEEVTAEDIQDTIEDAVEDASDEASK